MDRLLNNRRRKSLASRYVNDQPKPESSNMDNQISTSVHASDSNPSTNQCNQRNSGSQNSTHGAKNETSDSSDGTKYQKHEDGKVDDYVVASTAIMVTTDPKQASKSKSTIVTSQYDPEDSIDVSLNHDNQSDADLKSPWCHWQHGSSHQNNDEQHDATMITGTNTNADTKDVPNLYNTEGIYMHAIVKMCFLECGAVICWLYALGALLLIASQIYLLSIFAMINLEDLVVSCLSNQNVKMLTVVLMSIIFVCIVYEDVKESIVEEVIMNHAILHRKDKIHSMRAVELIQMCLRIRRFMFPWWLIAVAMLSSFFNENMNISDIILNFVSISFIVEADNFLGRFFFTESDQAVADKVVADVKENFSEQERKNVYVSTTSLLWSRMLVVVPTMIVTIGSIALMSGCSSEDSFSRDKLSTFLLLRSMYELPLFMMSVYGLICFIRDKNNGILFERWMRMLGDWLLNGMSFCIIFIFIDLLTSLFFIKRSVFYAILFFGWLSRIYYINKLENQENAWKHMVIAMTWSLVLVGSLSYWLYATITSNW